MEAIYELFVILVLKFKHLIILNNAHGKGLYAMDVKKEPTYIIFRTNEEITEYNGEEIKILHKQ